MNKHHTPILWECTQDWRRTWSTLPTTRNWTWWSNSSLAENVETNRFVIDTWSHVESRWWTSATGIPILCRVLGREPGGNTCSCRNLQSVDPLVGGIGSNVQLWMRISDKDTPSILRIGILSCSVWSKNGSELYTKPFSSPKVEYNDAWHKSIHNIPGNIRTEGLELEIFSFCFKIKSPQA